MAINYPWIIMNIALAGSCCLPDENFGLTQTTQKTQNLFARSNGLEFTEIANCCALAGLRDASFFWTRNVVRWPQGKAIARIWRMTSRRLNENDDLFVVYVRLVVKKNSCAVWWRWRRRRLSLVELVLYEYCFKFSKIVCFISSHEMPANIRGVGCISASSK